MGYPGPLDALWLIGAVFFVILVLAGTLVPLYAALFFKLDEKSTKLERACVMFGHGLYWLSMVVVGTFGVGFAIVVMTRVWRLT